MLDHYEFRKHYFCHISTWRKNEYSISNGENYQMFYQYNLKVISSLLRVLIFCFIFLGIGCSHLNEGAIDYRKSHLDRLKDQSEFSNQQVSEDNGTTINNETINHDIPKKTILIL